MNQQQHDHAHDENVYTDPMLINIPPIINNEMSREQQIVYCNPPANYQTLNHPQGYLYPQQVSNGQIVNQFSPANLTAQHHQQQYIAPPINMPHTLA